MKRLLSLLAGLSLLVTLSRPTFADGGVTVKRSSTSIAFLRGEDDANGAIVTTGTTTLKLYEVQDDGTLKSYDWASNTFKTTALTTETVNMTNRSGNNGASATGIWTYSLSTLTGFTKGRVYIAVSYNTLASPPLDRTVFQFGGVDGDATTDSSGNVLSSPQTQVTVATNNDKTGYTVSTVQDKTGYSLVQAFPTNFANLALTAGGQVTVGTNNDKTGYALSQAFPTNFSTLSIDGNGRLTLTPAEHALYGGDVLNSTASNFNSANTIGQKINSAASAGNPWTTDISSGYTGTQAGSILYAIRSGQPVTVGGYATGQDPATLVLAATIDGSMTLKQIQALSLAYLTGKYTTVRDTNAKTLTTTYKRQDGTTTLAVSVTSYSDSGLTQPTGRTWTYSNLP